MEAMGFIRLSAAKNPSCLSRIILQTRVLVPPQASVCTRVKTKAADGKVVLESNCTRSPLKLEIVIWCQNRRASVYESGLHSYIYYIWSFSPSIRALANSDFQPQSTNSSLNLSPRSQAYSHVKSPFSPSMSRRTCSRPSLCFKPCLTAPASGNSLVEVNGRGHRESIGPPPHEPIVPTALC